MQRTARVVMIHDYPFLFEGVRAILSGQPGVEVVAEARTATDVLVLCSEHPPDVVIVDLGPNDADALQMLKQVRDLCADVRVMIITSVCGPSRMRAAVGSGAKALLSRTATQDHLVNALWAVLQDQCYVDPELAGVLVTTVAMIPGDTVQSSDVGYGTLTAREREVFRLLANGMNNKSIAFQLGISHKTVETHHLRIMRKLGLSDSLDVIRYAARIGLIEVQEWVTS